MMQVRKRLAIAGAVAVLPLVASGGSVTGSASSAAGLAHTVTAHLPAVHPSVSDYVHLTSSETPPTETDCTDAGRRCFTPASTHSAYDLAPVYDAGIDGHGITVAIVDSYGSDTIRHDLHVYDQAFGLPPMCGEAGVTCTSGMPTFNTLALQGSPATKAPPTNNGKSQSAAPSQEDKSSWALETSLDVEMVHSIAPGANILLVTTPTAETLGVQGFPQMMSAEQYVVDHHLAQVISQSFGAAEESFGSAKSLQSLRHAYISAAQNGVTVLASTGDNGTANPKKEPTSQGGSTIPYPTVGWPASDPLVTGVGGTYLCTDPTATDDQARTVDSTDAPANCQSHPGQGEIAWIDAGGGYSHVFAKPDYQDTLPAGSTAIDSMRGVPDVGLQASARTGPLMYLTLPPDGQSGLICPDGNPCSTGWYDIGGTSVACPEWAGIVALADQVNGGGLGLINPALYTVANGPNYASDFYDVTTGNNQADPAVPGYPASTGWDPVTGLGTPNAANLIPDLVAASH
jgi:subtilase family serine protease